MSYDFFVYHYVYFTSGQAGFLSAAGTITAVRRGPRPGRIYHMPFLWIVARSFFRAYAGPGSRYHIPHFDFRVWLTGPLRSPMFGSFP